MGTIEGQTLTGDGRRHTKSAEELVAELMSPEEGRIPAFIYSRADIYELELQRIFAKCWVFVAHETEVPAPGDYVTRRMGEDSVIVTRDEDSRIHVFLNMCRHRGMRLCRADLGNTSHFRCPYHGFTYRNDGKLIGVPFQKEAYGDALDKEQLGLVQARSETYAGLVFATWDAQNSPLERYLGDMRWYLDLLLKRADMEVLGPPQRWEVDTNWKLPADNFSSDAYHTATTHASVAAIGLTPTITFGKDGYQIRTDNGHGLGLGIGPTPVAPPELMKLYERHLGSQQLAVWGKMKNLHCTIFPNLSLLMSSAAVVEGQRVPYTTVRQWQPRGPNEIEVWSWLVVEREASAKWKELCRRAYILTFGPSGIFEQDDTENWSNITRNASGVMARNIGLFNYTMGLQREVEASDFPGPGTVLDRKFQEANARSFYRRWMDLLLLEP